MFIGLNQIIDSNQITYICVLYSQNIQKQTRIFFLNGGGGAPGRAGPRSAFGDRNIILFDFQYGKCSISTDVLCVSTEVRQIFIYISLLIRYNKLII